MLKKPAPGPSYYPIFILSVVLYFLLVYLFIMALLGLCCCMGFSLVVVSRGYFVSGCGLLTAVAFLVAEHKLWSTQASVVAVPGL